MKKSLPKKSKLHETKIQKITDAILKTGGDKIAFVILFGSFARGDWVYDRYSEGGNIYSYASDYDILIITKTKKQGGGYSALNFKDKIEKEIDKLWIVRQDHHPHIIIESLDHVNSELEKSRYFFSDIKKEGVLLYKAEGEFELSPPKKLNEKERREIAREDYEHWFEKSEEFLKYTKFGIQENALNSSAFQLHQATESLFNCALLVLTGYKPKTHDLEELNKLCSSQNNKFLNIFPKATKAQKQSFDLLQAAYIEARYDKYYKIAKEQLEYLVERVEGLREVVEEVCGEKIRSFD